MTRESWLMAGGAICLAVSQTFAFCTNAAIAQITPDATLPNNSSVKLEGSTFNITGGTKAGRNLFHSFERFSIPTGGTAFFNHAADIQNIISRVTGKSVSNIDGLIRTLGTANLFLINPSGIIFGQNASLNIGGSFVATTANTLQFGNQGFFSTSASTVSPELLTVNPSALFYNQIASQPITSQARLRLPSGKSLLFVGGDVKLDGGRLLVPGGHVELGGVTGSGTVGLNVNGEYLDLSFPEGVQRSDVSLTNRALVDVTTGGGGSITINARNLDILGKSRLAAGIKEYLETVGSQAGDITLNTTGTITIGQSSSIKNEVGNDATGNSGDINIKAGSSLVIDSAILSTSSDGQGDAGSISVQANGNISFANTKISSTTLGTDDTEKDIVGHGDAASISVQTNNGNISFANKSELASNTTGKGNAGSVSLQANGNISFVDNSRISNYTTGKGDAGSVSLRANGSINFANSFIYSTVESEGEGKGGNIQIWARSLSLTDGAEFSATTQGKGNAGNIQVNAVDSVTLSGVSVKGFSDGLFTFTDKGASGQSVDPALSLSFPLSNVETGFSSGLFTNTESGASGQGGDITVRTGALRILDGAVLSARTRSDLDGRNITVNANTLEIMGSGQILTTTFSSGNAGSITVNAANSITISGHDPTYFRRLDKFGRPIVDPASDASGVFSNTNLGSTGKGAEINIRSGKLLVQDGAQVNVSSEGTGNAGSLRVEANLLKLDNQGKLLASTASGEGGNIDLQVRDLIEMRHQSLISAQANGSGNGGNITINAKDGFVFAVPLENSNIVANANFGNGGNIKITTQGIYGLQYRPKLTELSDINASSQFGVNGTVQINTSDIDPTQGLINLPSVPVDPKVAQGCTAGASQNQNKFVITGRGGLPLNPREAFNNNDTVRVDWVTLNPSSDNRHHQTVVTKPTIPTLSPIVQATGWVINDKGEVLLIASAPNSTPHSSWQTPTTCGAPKSAFEH
ncbi:MAG: filamentous hemagglutinin N-terminal domain-containing protein [Rhizonema sp. PD38]|nr:filamentous hemagglutinin N-terminal domain-containing protein [Rhizonema sp. PD38]